MESRKRHLEWIAGQESKLTRSSVDNVVSNKILFATK
jgi:hypothetical protein